MTSASSTGTDAKRKRNLPACLQIRENEVLCSRNADDVVEVNGFDCGLGKTQIFLCAKYRLDS
jgi:hypothetical protein